MTTFAEGMPGMYWVTVTNHPIIKRGTRYLAMREAEHEGYWICWKDGIKPPGGVFGETGTLLKPKHFERETEEDKDGSKKVN